MAPGLAIGPRNGPLPCRRALRGTDRIRAEPQLSLGGFGWVSHQPSIVQYPVFCYQATPIVSKYN